MARLRKAAESYVTIDDLDGDLVHILDRLASYSLIPRYEGVLPRRREPTTIYDLETVHRIARYSGHTIMPRVYERARIVRIPSTLYEVENLDELVRRLKEEDPQHPVDLLEVADFKIWDTEELVRRYKRLIHPELLRDVVEIITSKIKETKGRCSIDMIFEKAKGDLGGVVPYNELYSVAQEALSKYRLFQNSLRRITQAHQEVEATTPQG